MLAVGVVVIVGIAAVGADTLVESDPLAEDPAGVELPDPEDVDDAQTDGEPPADPEGSVSEPARGRELSCEPEGCELWRLPHGSGRIAVAGSVLVTAERRGAADGAGEAGHGAVRLRGNSIIDGAELWGTEVAIPAHDGDPTRWTLQALDDGAVVLASERTVSLVEPGDGEVRWTVELEHEVGFVRPLGDGHLYLFRETEDVAPAEPDDEGGGRAEGPASSEAPTLAPSVSSVLDRSTGDLSWSEEGLHVVAVVGDLALTTGEGRRGIEARQIATGDVVWSHEVAQDTPYLPQRLGDDRVLITLSGSLQVLDTTDGEFVTEVDIGLDGIGDVQVVGDLVLVIEGTPGQAQAQEPRRGKLVDLGGPGAEHRQLERIVQAVPLVPAFGGHDPWARPDPTGMALSFQDAEWFEIQVVDPHGEVRWSVEAGLDEPTCCLRVHATGGDDHLIIVPPAGDEPPALVSTEDGAGRGTIVLPDDGDRDAPPMAFGDLMFVQGRDGDRSVLAGDEGYVTVAYGGPRHFGPPVVVVGGQTDVVGIDPNLLFGSELREARGWYADG